MRDASFHLLDRAAWPRSEHFDYYIRTVKCRYDLTAHLAVTALRERGKALGLRFYPLLLYIATRAINANREFRMGFNEHGAPGYWDFINPSYTIFHDDDKTFSDVWSEYDESFPVFYQNVLHDMETYKDIKGVRAKPGRPANCCPMSALPWLELYRHGPCAGHGTALPAAHHHIRQVLRSGAGHAPADRRLRPSCGGPTGTTPASSSTTCRRSPHPPTNGCAPDASAI